MRPLVFRGTLQIIIERMGHMLTFNFIDDDTYMRVIPLA